MGGEAETGIGADLKHKMKLCRIGTASSDVIGHTDIFITYNEWYLSKGERE